MTSNRRDIQMVLYLLDDLATAMGRPFAKDTQEAFKIIDAVERMFGERDRRPTGMDEQASLIFRCVRCGVEFAPTLGDGSAATVENGHAAMRSLLAIGRHEIDASGDYIRSRVLHRCASGAIGVADLIGCDPTPTPAG